MGGERAWTVYVRVRGHVLAGKRAINGIPELEVDACAQWLPFWQGRYTQGMESRGTMLRFLHLRSRGYHYPCGMVAITGISFEPLACDILHPARAKTEVTTPDTSVRNFLRACSIHFFSTSEDLFSPRAPQQTFSVATWSETELHNPEHPMLL